MEESKNIMSDKERKNENLDNEKLSRNAQHSNMPDHLIPVNHSDTNTEENVVKPEDRDNGKSFGKGDFGSEEARSDSEKGNKGSAGNIPFSKEED